MNMHNTRTFSANVSLPRPRSGRSIRAVVRRGHGGREYRGSEDPATVFAGERLGPRRLRGQQTLRGLNSTYGATKAAVGEPRLTLATKLPFELLGEVDRGLNLGKMDRDALNVDPERNPHTSAVSDQFTSGA